MLHNQFYDFELECPFFHDKKDRRRLVIPEKPQEEFMYKGKYQEGLNEESLDASYSYNYFESVFHPLFYKFFDCKRSQCRGSIFCPMRHADEERIVWEEEFSLNWRKDRSIYYPKKKRGQYQTEFSENDINEKIYVRKQHHKKKPHQRYNNDQYNQKQSSGYESKDKENFTWNHEVKKNINEHQGFFEAESMPGESKFLKFFSATDYLNSQTYGNEEKSDDGYYKYFPEKENQPLFNIQKVFSNAFNSNEECNEMNQKKFGFYNGKKAHQSMQNQSQNPHIKVL